MIEARPRHWLSRHYQLYDGPHVWTELRFDDHGADAGFVLDGRHYRTIREIAGVSLWKYVVRSLRGRNIFRLEQDGVVVAHAQGEGAFSGRYRVWTEAGEEYRLHEQGKQVSLLRDGVGIGRIARRGALARGLWAELPAEVPAPLRVFIIWLLLSRWETIGSGGGE